MEEAVRFLNMKCGDRIGHGLVLGIDTEEWYQLKNYRILISQQDYLDNVVWLYMKIKLYGLENCQETLLHLEEEYNKYFRMIYGKNIQAEGYKIDSSMLQGLICIDGLDSFVNDDIRVFELFCSYFSTYTSKRIHVILTLNNEKVLPLSVKNKITDDDIFDMGLFSIIAIRDFLLRKLVINDVEKYVEQIAEKSEGHALYLHYIIESVNHLSQDEDMAFFIEKFPAYGGDIRKYYDYKWDEIKKKESNVKLVSYLARVRI